MSKSNSSLLFFIGKKQKVGSVRTFGQKFTQTNTTFFSRFGLVPLLFIGLFLASTIALLGPIYFYPGTVVAQAASKTLASLNNQGLRPAMRAGDAVMAQVREGSRRLLTPAPISLTALISQPTSLPKLVLPTPVLALPKEEKESVVMTADLITETIKDGIDPMITSSQIVLFPTEISLGKVENVENVGGRGQEADPTKGEEAVVTPSPKTILTPTPKPKEASVVVPQIQNAVFNGNYRWPVTGSLSQRFSRYHPGIDIATKYGTAVFPLTDGVVTGVINQGVGLGKHIIIDHANGLRSV